MRFFKRSRARSRNPSHAIAPEPLKPVSVPPIAFSTVSMPSPAIVSRPQVNAEKTRLIGFDSSDLVREPDRTADSSKTSFIPVGWLVVATEPGQGQCFALAAGLSTIGRGEDQSVCLDFGDRAISRNNHAAIVYDPSTNEFFLGHGGKANLVRLNGSPVTETVSIESGAEIQVGETKLVFKALCDSAFRWDTTDQKDNGNAVDQ
ncbi:FHA domain-containing protein [uncultured Ruegeria sp.]|uniref:FHA domain-containing protein n=1 Tax=uncultured Ruegeria sp. TaxID=259304 RepID=UPI00261B5C88|nr:FHA domain-containing protein [uncultured Ruegeria sp.]